MGRAAGAGGPDPDGDNVDQRSRWMLAVCGGAISSSGVVLMVLLEVMLVLWCW